MILYQYEMWNICSSYTWPLVGGVICVLHPININCEKATIVHVGRYILVNKKNNNKRKLLLFTLETTDHPQLGRSVLQWDVKGQQYDQK